MRVNLCFLVILPLTKGEVWRGLVVNFCRLVCMYKISKQCGFSLVEVIVVTGIVALAFMGILGLIRRSITISYSNQNYLSANMMAQEGLELARYVRDQNWLTGRTFATDLTAAVGGEKTVVALDAGATSDRTKIKKLYSSQSGVINPPDCGLAASGALSEHIKSSCAVIYEDKDNGNAYRSQIVNNIVAGDSAYKKTIFNRLLEITYYDNSTSANMADDYIYVASMVYWKDRGAEKYITLGTYLYDYSWRF